MVNSYVQRGNEKKVALSPSMIHDTSAPVVEPLRMEPRSALEHRKLHPLTPYRADAWEHELQEAGILERFTKIPFGFRYGFHIDFPTITSVQTPPNRASITEYEDEFNKIIRKELEKGRYIGPFTADVLETLIGPFQSSPLSIIPKPGKPGKFRIIQNFSFPLNTCASYPNPSVNSQINADNFPTTWGKFSTIYRLISRLPPGSEAATRDVAEAYRTVPLHNSQWPAGVVRILDNLFCVDTCTAFGATPSAGAYGHVADAGAEIFHHHGIGPLDKWVNDHIFFRIRREHLSTYNQQRLTWSQTFAQSGIHQSGGRLWYGNQPPDKGQMEEYSENCLSPLKDLSESSSRSDHDQLFAFNLQDIDDLSIKLGIIWELLKDQPFRSSTIYIGFLWDLEIMIVSLSIGKVDKYLAAIHKCRKRRLHVLRDVQELYGKLLHACAAVP
jgi:hypothetical protein